MAISRFSCNFLTIVRKSNAFMLLACFCMTAIGPAFAVPPEDYPRDKSAIAPADRLTVQVALLLDTSNSMDGLITQAKAQLWRIVNEFGSARRAGVAPNLEVALYEYGNTNIAVSEGYLRQVIGFTNDLDLISEKLFALSTNGGDEYCGKVIQSALDGLYWNPSPQSLKIIYIAGNEPFTQGDVDYRQVCPRARTKNILVNTIHCGNSKEGVDGRWKDGALLADGMFFNINQDERPVVSETPFDSELIRLNELLNKTYIPYGKAGAMASANQQIQDSNASSLSKSTLATRAGSKASSLYCTAGWDLVDAYERKTLELEKIDRDELPKNMRDMTLTQRKEFIESQLAERNRIRLSIAKIQIERSNYIEKKSKELKGVQTLESAILDSIHVQASKLGFAFVDAGHEK